ncbi:NmrA-like family protein [Aspergillus ibericus CBS 121593]|uniref:NAD(P)-binding protein n=1 Tax=Aspergillus ibericus CBS 121593 TaxID=1448316 RepID=A0A395GM86_9EURO|nr:NAD(P)-binding protein [Aspergillus ibericus CBS 121593]RAK96615.1 NAD(P)-binding protein [Aspergillus ibericus CBS 121593]
MTIALLITGATGNQGGAVINALLAQDADVEILAVTRNPQSGTSQKLTEKSPKIKLVQGDLDHPAEIFENAKKVTALPITGVFSVQTPMAKGQNVTKEEQQGKALIDESIKHEVKQFVYSSVDRGGDASTDNPTNIPHFISKHRIEHHLFEKTKTGAMDWTVLRPVFFFENLVPTFVGKVSATAFDAYLQGKPLQCIAVSDIGVFAAKAFLEPQRYKNQCLSLAGDDMTYEHMQKTFKAKTGKNMPTTYRVVCYLLMWMVSDLRVMFNWFYEHGYGADIQGLRKMHPGLKNFEAWLEHDSQWMTS